MNIDVHPPIAMRATEASNLLLSCGVDWQIGLWYPKHRKTPVLINDLDTEVFDIKWSPAHPTVFATGDCDGNIDLWNLAYDTENYQF